MNDKKPLINTAIFFILAFVISWLLWLPQLLTSNDLVQLPEFTGAFGMIAPFGPFIAAFWLTSRQSGWEGVKALWKKGWSLKFDKIWLLPTLLLLPLAGLVTVVVMKLTGQLVQWEYGVSGLALLPTFFIIYLLNSLPEEYGWRGYALGPLSNRFNALAASIILGLLWGLWHLPLHFIEGTVQANIPVYQFILQQIVLAIFYTWLYKNTNGVILISILFHTVGNVVGAAIPYWTTNQGRWINFGVLVIFAVAIVLIWGPEHLSRSGSRMEETHPVG